MKSICFALLIAIQGLALESKILELNQVLDGDLATPYPAFQSDDDWNVMAKLFKPKTRIAKAWAKRFLKQGITKNRTMIDGRQKLVSILNNQFDDSYKLGASLEAFSEYESDVISSFASDSRLNGSDIQTLFYHDEQFIAKLSASAVEQAVLGNMSWESVFYKILLQYTSVPLLLLASYHQTKWVLTGGSSRFSKYFYALWTPMQLWGVLSDPFGVHFDLQKSHQTLAVIPRIAKAIELLLEIDHMGSWLPNELVINVGKIDRNNFEYFVRRAASLNTENKHFFQLSLAQEMAVFRIYMELRKPLAKYLERLAKLDFYLSVASSVRHHPDQFSFVQFESDSSHILIEAQNLWNPLLDTERAVKNNVSLNAQTMLTGPNASGKSTLMKSVAMNAHLAQTIGIVAASQYRTRLLNYIHSLLTHRDKTGKLSSYQMELSNIRSIIKTLPVGPGLVIMDEPFRSTNLVEAEIASRRVLNYLCGFQELAIVVSTHLSELTQGDAPCQRVNKHMKDYQIQEGAFTGSNALEILRRRLHEKT